ncbi:MAG: hypothetical protein EXX96DRAFT_646630 [Benjaminiella poitrasii]|nr:MAG: hypothetical protein EXX96DRAFT_646630 [Benjaminiella poitrasii]
MVGLIIVMLDPEVELNIEYLTSEVQQLAEGIKRRKLKAASTSATRSGPCGTCHTGDNCWRRRAHCYGLGRRSAYPLPRHANPPSTIESLDVEMEEAADIIKNLIEHYDGYPANKNYFLSTTTGLKGQFEERHKIHLLNFYDDNPQAQILDTVASLTEEFKGFTLKETSAKKLLERRM